VPQLERGGKYVFGWSVLHPDGSVRLPPEAVIEYRFPRQGSLVVMSGSKTSRGMRVGAAARLEGTVLDPVAAIPCGDGLARLKNSLVATAMIHDGVMTVPTAALEAFGLAAGDRLLVIRGSSLAFVMAQTGPLVEIGRKHPEVAVFE
jgi:hypothetical protein